MESFVLYRCKTCPECTRCNVLGIEYMCRNCGTTMAEDGVWVREATQAALVEALEAVQSVGWECLPNLPMHYCEAVDAAIKLAKGE